MTEFEGFWLIFCLAMVAFGLAAGFMGDGRAS